MTYLSTRDKILREAEKLISAQGVYGFNLKAIAEKLSIRTPSIYKHFPGKDDIVIELSRKFIVGLSNQFRLNTEQEPNTNLMDGLSKFVEFNINHPAS